MQCGDLRGTTCSDRCYAAQHLCVATLHTLAPCVCVCVCAPLLCWAQTTARSTCCLWHTNGRAKLCRQRHGAAASWPQRGRTCRVRAHTRVLYVNGRPLAAWIKSTESTRWISINASAHAAQVPLSLFAGSGPWRREMAQQTLAAMAASLVVDANSLGSWQACPPLCRCGNGAPAVGCSDFTRDG